MLQAYLALRDPLMRLLDEIMEMRGPKEHWHIYTTGHSMGGALSSLLAYELSVSHLALFAAQHDLHATPLGLCLCLQQHSMRQEASPHFAPSICAMPKAACWQTGAASCALLTRNARRPRSRSRGRSQT